jgi:hypothetical protein
LTPYGTAASAGDLTVFLATPGPVNPNAPNMKYRHQISLDMQAYMNVIQSPAFPKAVDWKLAGEGLGVYSKNCACCHGSLVLEEADGKQYSANTRVKLVYNKTQGRVALHRVGTDDLYWHHEARSRDVIDHLLRNGEAVAYRLNADSPRAEKEPYICAPPLVGM